MATQQPRRFLERTDDIFLTQVMKDLMRADCLLDLTLANKAELVRDVKAGGSLGCSNHEIVDFRIMRGGEKSKKKQDHSPGIQKSCH